jgi:1-deoxy-D-xylulose-5-phosphate synthase
MTDWQKPFREIEIGKGRIVSEGTDVAVLSVGHPGNFVQEAINEISDEYNVPAHFDLRFVKPLDEELLHNVFMRFKKIITVEDGTVIGGFGSAILEFMADNGYNCETIRLGVPDKFIEHGSLQELYSDCGYDVESITRILKKHAIKKTAEKISTKI